ncbi:HYES hydrolase, partial [Nicator chloris]|nr:HYES hydrolase [Nicator chloris]
GFLTAVLARGWVDDGPGRLRTAALLERLRRRFHLVLESCRIGIGQSEPGILGHALEALRAQPQEV